LCLAALAGASTRTAVATDLDTVRERAQRVADEVSSLERRLEVLRAERARIESDVVGLTRRIAALELVIDHSEERADDARRRYVERAVEIYKDGATADLALVLSARDLGDLLAVAEATSRAARDDRRALEELAAALAAGDVARLTRAPGPGCTPR
jgi:peptidoglycan hydrolase CwlO-like protein